MFPVDPQEEHIHIIIKMPGKGDSAFVLYQYTYPQTTEITPLMKLVFLCSIVEQQYNASLWIFHQYQLNPLLQANFSYLIHFFE